MATTLGANRHRHREVETVVRQNQPKILWRRTHANEANVKSNGMQKNSVSLNFVARRTNPEPISHLYLNKNFFLNKVIITASAF